MVSEVMDQWALRLPDNETIMEMVMLMLTTNMANPIHDHVIKYPEKSELKCMDLKPDIVQ